MGDPAGPTPRPVPSGASYVIARWRELADVNTPWWARSSGVGIRMALRELLDMSRASQDGTLLEVTLSRLRDEARDILLAPKGVLAERYPLLAGQLRNALQTRPAPNQFLPGGRNHSTVKAALDYLDENHSLIAVLADVLGQRAPRANDWVKLAELDEVIMLLDDELAYAGYSRTWRTQVVDEVAQGLASGDELAVAIKDSIRHARSGWPHDIEWVFPVQRRVDRQQPLLSNNYQEEDLVTEVLLGWPDLPEPTPELVDGAFVILVPECADLAAGRARAEDWLGRQVGLWQLQGGEVSVEDRVMYHDRVTDTVGWLELRPPLPLLPPHLDKLEGALGGEPVSNAGDQLLINTLADAIVQLSQARSSTPGPALSDLWTVAEAVFGGHAAETSAGTAEVIADVAQFLYPVSLLQWFAKRFGDLSLEGVQSSSSLPAHVWALEVFEKHAAVLFKALEADPAQALVYVRAKAFAAWGDSGQMGEELDSLRRRIRRVADRAYLVRNLSVHAAQPHRARALAVTLPVFAAVLTACLGFVLEDEARTKDPLVSAQLAVMRIRGVAERYAREKPKTPDLLRECLRI